MTETAQARCHHCAGELPAVGAPCPRCAPGAAQAGTSPSAAQGTPTSGPASGPHAVPFQPWPQQGTPYPGNPYPGSAYPGGPYPGAAYPGSPYPGTAYSGVPYQGAPWSQTPQPGSPFSPPYAGAPYPAGYPQFPGVPQPRPRKEAAIAIVLTVLWVGAGHLYLGRGGMGAALMAGHFFLGLFFLVLFPPLAVLLWIAAVVGCSVWCSNLTAEINAGTAPATATW